MSIELLQWAVTGRCNYACRHCYMRAPEGLYGELCTKDMLRIVDILHNSGVRRVSITGGEPLVRVDFLELVRGLTSRGMSMIWLATNGALLTRDVLNILDECGQHPRINISYDGDLGKHDWLRGLSVTNDQSYATDAALRAFDLCHDSGFETSSEMSVHRGNADVIAQSILTLAAHGCSEVKVLPVCLIGRAESGVDALSCKELYGLFADSIERLAEASMPTEVYLAGLFHCAKGSTQWSVPIEHSMSGTMGLKSYPCEHSKYQPYLAPDGRLLPCAGIAGFPDIERTFPRVLDIGIDDCINSEAFRAFWGHTIERHFNANAECACCESRNICGGGCRVNALAAGADMNGCDPYCCEYFNSGWRDRVSDAMLMGSLSRMLSPHEK